MSTVNTDTGFFRVVAIAIAFTTILALSGVVYLAPLLVRNAHAQTIADGDLVRVTGTDDIFIVKLVGAKSFKRLILNPTIFDSYGHLDWGNVMDVSQATVDGYTNTNLVIEVNPDGSIADPKVYAVTSAEGSDVGERRHLNVTAAEFEAAGLDWDSLYNINATEASPSFYPTMTALVAADALAIWATNVLGGTQGGVLSGLSVSVASSTPSDQTVAKGAVGVVFAKYNLAAGTSGAVKINEITVIQGGLSTTTDYQAIKLYRNSVAPENRVGASLVLSTTTQKARFTGLNWTVNAGTTDMLLVTATVAKTVTVVGAIMKLGINAASDIVLDGGEVVSGSFPLFANSVTAANLAVGNLGVKMLATPTDSNMVSGSTDQHVGTVEFVTDDENFRVQSIFITQTNTAIPADVSNLTIKYLGEVLATIPSLSASNTGIFTLSTGADGNANLVKDGLTKRFDIYADIGGGINVQRKVTISIQQASHVIVRGESSGGLVTAELYQATGTLDNSPYITTSGADHTITQGTLTIVISSAFNPSADSVVVGSDTRKATAFRFSAGSDEGARVTEFTTTVTLGGGALVTALGTITLAHVNEDGSVGATIAEGVISGTTLTFGTNDINTFDTVGLFDVEKSKNVDVYILFSLAAGTYVDGNDTYGFGLAATSGHVKADGLSSLNDLPAITPTALTGPVYTESQKGTIAYSTSGSPSGTTIVPGATDVDFAHWQVTVSGEDVLISSMAIRAVKTDNTVTVGSNDLINVRLYKESISAENLLFTQATVSAGVVSASFSDTIVAGTTRIYIIVADLLTTADEVQIRFEALNDATTGVVASGIASGETIAFPASDELDANFMTIAAGTLGVIASGLPIYTNVTQLSPDVEVARFVFTAGSSEAVRLNTVKVKLAGYADEAGTVKHSVNPTALTSIKLYDVSTGLQVGSTVGSLILGKAAFTGLAKIIAKDAQLVLGVKVTIGSVSVANHIVFGIDDYFSDISATGVDSGSTVYANQLVANGTNGTTDGTLGKLTTAITALTDEALTNNITGDFDGYGVPTLGITALAAGDVIQIDNEAMLINAVATSTVYKATNRIGFAGTSAVASHLINAPILLRVGGNTVLESGNSITTYTDGDGDIIFASSTAATISAGNLIAVYDPDVANQEDDIRLVTAVSTDGKTLTTVDDYQGALVTETTSNSNAVVVQLTNYGQAQQIQSVGTLTFAVSSGTPTVGQVVAGATDVEFSRLLITSLYEPILVKKLVMTRTGGSDVDFASVYLQNMTDSTWGPNGNGKSNTAQLVSGKVTFSFSDDDALVVDHLGTGAEFALKGNMNTTTTGVVSGDAPKFYMATVDTADVTAKGQATGTTLTNSEVSAGTPTPVTSGNFNSQVVYKGVLDIALNSGSLSGNQTRSSNQTILKLDFDSADSGTVATFRAATFPNDDVDATHVGAADNEIIASSARSIDGGISIQMIATAVMSDDDGFMIDLGSTGLMSATGARVNFWVNNNTIGNEDMAPAAIELCTGVTAAHTNCVAIPNSPESNNNYDVDMWWNIDMAMPTGTDSADQFIGIKVATVAALLDDTTSPDDQVFFDGFVIYTDKIVVNLAGNAGSLYDVAANTHTGSVTLKDGSTTLATGYYSASNVTDKQTSGTITFFPTSQFTIPTAGKTLSLVADTTILVTGAKTLSMNLGLGAVDNAGTITTSGDVWWWDTSTTSTIKWVDAVASPVQGGTISYQ